MTIDAWPLTREESVTWGPFPLQRLRLLSGIGLTALALLVGWMGSLRDWLVCTRSGPLAGQCVLRGGVRGNSQKTFAISSLHGVEVKRTESSNRGRTTKRGEVFMLIGAAPLSMRRESPEEAEAHVAALQNFLNHADVDKVEIATERSLASFLFVGLLGIFGLGLLYSVAFGRQRFRLCFDGAIDQLTVQREWPLGLAKGEPTTLNLRHPVEVEIDWGRVEDFWSSSRSPGAPGGRLRVRLEGGSSVPIDAGLWPGYGVHVQAAERLRAHLNCPTRSSQAAARIETAYDRARPRPAPQWLSWGGRVAAVWLGACTGSLVGLAMSATIAVVFRFQKLSDSAGGPWFFGGALGGVLFGIWFSWHFTQNGDER